MRTSACARRSLESVRDKLGGAVALWGGISGALTVERGTEDDVRAAVESAITCLGPTGRFILSPVDNVTERTEAARRNVAVSIDTWRQMGGS